jgi:hypothetical protein
VDPAAAAAQADPIRNPNFSRQWTPPPPKRKRPVSGPTETRAKIQNSTDAHITFGSCAAQRAIALATRRAALLERRAATLAEIGQRDAALRVAALADVLRGVAA